MRCYKCYGELGTADFDGLCAKCRYQTTLATTPTTPSGWVCPRCGVVYAPWVRTCECRGPTITITSNGEG